MHIFKLFINQVPNSVWFLNKLDTSMDKSKKDMNISMDNNDNEDSKWWNQVELTKLILASNKIKQIPTDIQQLDTLCTLDVCK